MNRQYRATYRAKGPSDTGTLMMVLGIIFTILFSFAIVNTVFQFIGGGLESLAELASLFLLLIGGIVLLCVGKSKETGSSAFGPTRRNCRAGILPLSRSCPKR